MVGAKASGALSGSVCADLAASYRYNNLLVSCTGYNLFKKTELAMLYEVKKDVRVSGVCKVEGLDKMPEFAVGVWSAVAENTIVRAKVNSAGEVSGCFKTTVNNKMTFSGAMTLDGKNLSNGNHKVGFGVEFLF